MPPGKTPVGDKTKEAIASLHGYVYQIYQSAIAWIDLKEDESLFLEVAEDYAVVANDAIKAVQVKRVASSVTINTNSIVASIDRFVELQEKNSTQKVTLRHLTTSPIGKELKPDNRVSGVPTLEAWRNLARIGDLSELRRVLMKSKISRKTKNYIERLDNDGLRECFLKRIHFDCGASDSRDLYRLIRSRVSALLSNGDGLHLQVEICTASLLFTVLEVCTRPDNDRRVLDRHDLEKLLVGFTHELVDKAYLRKLHRSTIKTLESIAPQTGDILGTHRTRPSSVSEIPLPSTLASRTDVIRKLEKTLEVFGVCWISGAVGMGKSIAARVLADRFEGRWDCINLRGQSKRQVALTLLQSADSLRESNLQCLIVDDLSYATDPSVLERLRDLYFTAQRSDVILVVCSTNLPSSDFLFYCDLDERISHILSEFTMDDIQEIIEKHGVSDSNWSQYTYLVSVGGHPQLTMALILSVAASGWNASKFKTLDTLLQGSEAVENTRSHIRQRLLDDLPPSSRQLIERLSLITGGQFGRELVIDLGKVEPTIVDAGILLESLVGSWINQQEGDRFCLSPLLSKFGTKTLGAGDREKIESAIAESLTKGGQLDVRDINSAMIAAWTSNNENAIMKLCLTVLYLDDKKFGLVAHYLESFAYFAHPSLSRLSAQERFGLPNSPLVRLLFRGVQLLLLNLVSESQDLVYDALCCFADEFASSNSNELFALMTKFIYSRLLLQTSRAGLGTGFTEVLSTYNLILEDETLPAELIRPICTFETDGIPVIGLMFARQIQQLKKIDDLRCVFDFLDNASADFRSKLIEPFRQNVFELDMLVAGAWLREQYEGTIDSAVHRATFSKLEEQAVNWGETDLAVCCRKYQAMILDEYGRDKEGALAVLDGGLSVFGKTNSELVRAKAKVLYRSGDHKGNLELSRSLIDGNAHLSGVERTFLGRDAAISAEKQGDYKAARRYYLYGSKAAKEISIPDMTPMHVGLLADAALASWRDGDRLTCLQEFVVVLEELNQFKPSDTLRTAHCHAIVRHILLWFYNETYDVEMRKNNIYPGCASNPEPSPEIRSTFIAPIEFAWYILASIENYAELDAGITDNLISFLPEGPIVEGQMYLAPSKMHKAVATLNSGLFVQALRDVVAIRSFGRFNDGFRYTPNLKKPTYCQVPIATCEQQAALREQTEKYILAYCANCVFQNKMHEIDHVISLLSNASGFSVSSLVLDNLQRSGPFNDFHTRTAQFILRERLVLESLDQGTPLEMVHLAVCILQIAKDTSTYKLLADALRPWFTERWSLIWENQRFLLKDPALHDDSIKKAMDSDRAPSERQILEILEAVLPTLGAGIQSEFEKILAKLPR